MKSINWIYCPQNFKFDRLYGPEHSARNNLETLDAVNKVRNIQLCALFFL